MGLIYKEKENLFGGYPVRKTHFKDDEVFHFDEIHKQWIAKLVDIPTALSDLEDDSTHRLVTETEKELWNSALQSDINILPDIGADIVDADFAVGFEGEGWKISYSDLLAQIQNDLGL